MQWLGSLTPPSRELLAAPCPSRPRSLCFAATIMRHERRGLGNASRADGFRRKTEIMTKTLPSCGRLETEYETVSCLVEKFNGLPTRFGSRLGKVPIACYSMCTAGQRAGGDATTKQPNSPLGSEMHCAVLLKSKFECRHFKLSRLLPVDSPASEFSTARFPTPVG